MYYRQVIVAADAGIRFALLWVNAIKEMFMKNKISLLAGILTGVLLDKYFPLVSRKLMVDYIVAAFLSLKISNLLDIGANSSKAILQ